MNHVFANILDSLACPQCGSGCGPYRCRFSERTHADYRAEQANRYAERMIERERLSNARPEHDQDANGRPLKVGS